MNRKLHRSSLALSATCAVFALLVLAGRPAQPLQAVPDTLVANVGVAAIDGTDSNTVVPRIEQPHHARHSRARLALPYFSFAQGLRRITGS